jgi:hypothetical protein
MRVEASYKKHSMIFNSLNQNRISYLLKAPLWMQNIEML